MLFARCESDWSPHTELFSPFSFFSSRAQLTVQRRDGVPYKRSGESFQRRGSMGQGKHRKERWRPREMRLISPDG